MGHREAHTQRQTHRHTHGQGHIHTHTTPHEHAKHRNSDRAFRDQASVQSLLFAAGGKRWINEVGLPIHPQCQCVNNYGINAWRGTTCKTLLQQLLEAPLRKQCACLVMSRTVPDSCGLSGPAPAGPHWLRPATCLDYGMQHASKHGMPARADHRIPASQPGGMPACWKSAHNTSKILINRQKHNFITNNTWILRCRLQI